MKHGHNLPGEGSGNEKTHPVHGDNRSGLCVVRVSWGRAWAADYPVTDAALLRTAFSSAADGDTITLSNDIDLGKLTTDSGDTVALAGGKQITLNLNDHELTGARAYASILRIDDSAAKLTITGGVNGKGSFTNTDEKSSGVISVGSGSTLTVQSGTLQGGGGAINSSGGSVNIEGGAITGIGGCLNCYGGTLSISGGTISTSNVLSNPVIIYGDCAMTMTGGEITSTDVAAVVLASLTDTDSTHATISAGTITAVNAPALEIKSSGSTTLSGTASLTSAVASAESAIMLISNATSSGALLTVNGAAISNTASGGNAICNLAPGSIVETDVTKVSGSVVNISVQPTTACATAGKTGVSTCTFVLSNASVYDSKTPGRSTRVPMRRMSPHRDRIAQQWQPGSHGL